MDIAEKSLIHISHLHPLELVTSPEPKPICHACNLQCGDQSYGCVKCRYFLHVTCASIKNNLHHPAHPAHTLSFELTPTYNTGKFRCNACGEEGSTFSLQCRECNYNLHLHCAALPEKINHQSHRHPLSLCYEHLVPHNPNGVTASCGLCPANVDLFKWFYRCDNGCKFSGHVACFVQNTVDVFSPGLQAPAPVPPQQPGQIGSATVDANAPKDLMDVQKQIEQATPSANEASGSDGRNFSGHVACFAQNTVDVFSPGLQAPAPVPPQQPEQIGSATVNANAPNDLMDVQKQIEQATPSANEASGSDIGSLCSSS